MKNSKRSFTNVASGSLQIIAVGVLTGLLAGLVVTLYALLAHMTEEFAQGYYGFFRDHPAFLPLLFAALFVGAVVVGGTLRFLPMIKGSGVPQIEGASRGVIKLKWFRSLTGTFAASLFTIFMGLSAGSEGPAILIGGACGNGVSDLLKRNATVRRYQITGGACAGLAVAFNAPLTGMAFAFEEAHKRFTPEVFACAFSSVVTAVLTRNLLYWAMGLEIGAFFSSFSFAGVEASDFLFYAYVLGATLVVSLAAAGFYKLIFLSKKFFRKLTFWKGMGKFLIPFLAAGAFGLVSVYAIGGGGSFITGLGSSSQGVQSVFGAPLWATLLIVVVLKTAGTVLNAGAGVPCGIFVPMLSIGAGMGALLALLCRLAGMDAAYSDALVIICMAAFFTVVVRAPITGIVMIAELTFSFLFLLPAILGVAVGYVVGDMFRLEPIYDRMLAETVAQERERNPRKKVALRFAVLAGSRAAERAVRDVLWPTGARIVRVDHGDENYVPDGNSVLYAGDILTVSGETDDEAVFAKALADLIGEKIEDQTTYEIQT